MKICPNCNNAINDEAMFCTKCGASQVAQQSSAVPQGAPVAPQAPPVAPASQAPQGTPVPPQQPYYAPQPVVDPYDHTAAFDAQDISDNKVIAMLVYLLGAVGILIALLSSKESKYVAFHLRQALKFLVVETLTGLATALLCWTFIVPIAGGILLVVLFVIKIIAFFQICSGKAKEPAIIRSLGFLK